MFKFSIALLPLLFTVMACMLLHAPMMVEGQLRRLGEGQFYASGKPRRMKKGASKPKSPKTPKSPKSIKSEAPTETPSDSPFPSMEPSLAPSDSPSVSNAPTACSKKKKSKARALKKKSTKSEKEVLEGLFSESKSKKSCEEEDEP